MLFHQQLIDRKSITFSRIGVGIYAVQKHEHFVLENVDMDSEDGSFVGITAHCCGLKTEEEFLCSTR